MKNILLILVLIFSVGQFTFAQSDSITVNKNVFSIVEKMPSWKGCESIEREAEKSGCTYESIMNYLMSEIKYPEAAKVSKTQGQVFINFIIDETGKVTEPVVVRGVSIEIDAEALRVVSKMPAWNPGMNEGEVVAVQYILPISFRLDQNKKR